MESAPAWKSNQGLDPGVRRDDGSKTFFQPNKLNELNKPNKRFFFPRLPPPAEPRSA
jgi:hypothetical protein